ncbi:MAG: hypothetical protein WCC06_11420 [Candidatus Aminicenantales bacterium]
MKKYFSGQFDTEYFGEKVKELIQRSNSSALQVMSLAADFMKDRTENEIYEAWPFLERLALEEEAAEDFITASLDSLESLFAGRGP